MNNHCIAKYSNACRIAYVHSNCREIHYLFILNVQKSAWC